MSEPGKDIFDQINDFLENPKPMSNNTPQLDDRNAESVAQIAQMHYGYWKELTLQENSDNPPMPKELIEALTMMFANAHLHRIMCPTCNPPENLDNQDDE